MPTQQAGVTMLDEFANRNPGAMWVATLQGGEDIGVINPNAPSDSFGTFFEAFASNLGQSMSIGYEAVMLKFGENYSASRALLVLLWRVLKMFTAGAAADFYNPVVEMWLAEEIAAGRTKAPGWNDPRLKAAWCLARWIGSSIPSIDPKKEAEAAKSRMETGSTTGDDEALQYNGSNGEANRAQLKKEYQNLPVAPFSKNYQKPGGINE
jgi:capsid protein